ncbi:hypothetical protein N658DRAFT_498401 [Parathielavia hyrcaniae]|uniref:Zn(2)-C6 fungal-type domain-containing protein n=1 Tax=Parathielavia hyrcaniae TaxID=113614 RepID=A0AAN6Q1W4_9PEZI|nr:hypothetical protein N658DRAFT_498401 [Parathielavia hyrcaniae]
MDLLETQVSEVRSFLGVAGGPQVPEVASPHDISFAQTPDPLLPRAHHSFSAPGDISAPGQHQSQSPIDATNLNAHTKRRADDADDGPARQQRSKRNRYISIACNECKRRKIKCNGQTPCQRCGHLNLQCLYAPNCCSSVKDSDEFKDLAAQVRHLQDEVGTLFNSMNALRQETARLAPLQDRVLPPPAPSPAPSFGGGGQRPTLPYRVPSFFNGPTSIAFTVDVAKNTLHNMGYSGEEGGNDDSGGRAQPDASPRASPLLAPVPSGSLASSQADPIFEFDEAEMQRLMQVYREEIDVMWPVASIGPISEHIKALSPWMDAARRAAVTVPPGLESLLSDHKTMLLKIILCCCLAVTEHGNSEKAARLYASIQPTVDKMLMSSPADVTTLSFLALCAGYRYLSNDEILAWRLIGQIARLCFELGLHRREGLLQIADPQIRRDALHIFWASYILDRRWSFSTGLPYVCHDDKIDPNLPYPEEYPFLVAMIGYSKLGAKVWKLVDHFEPTVTRELKPHDFEELDREVMVWWFESVPEAIRTVPLDGDTIQVPTGPYDLQRLRVWTRLRLNQVRIWLYTPVLHSATSISHNAHLAHKVVDLAKQTIRLLTHLNNETDLYRRIQVFYHQFLTSAIAVLFLASTHAPLQFSAACRDEFYMALDLVKEMSSKSWVSHRLWRTIRSLRAYAPKLGLADSSQSASASTSASAARVASAGPSSYTCGDSVSSGQSPGFLGGSLDSGGNSIMGAGSRSGSRGPVMTTSSQALATTGTTQPMQIDDESNGLRLQSEMLRIYEGYLGMTGVVAGVGGLSSPVADMGYRDASLGLAGPGGGGGAELLVGHSDGGVYQQMKDMF